MANETIHQALKVAISDQERALEREAELNEKAGVAEAALQREVARNRVLTSTLTSVRGFLPTLFGDPDIAGEARSIVADIDAALKVT